MLTSQFDFHLPEGLIAQHPSAQRDASRLLVLNRKTNKITHHIFHELTRFLDAGDLLVVNNSKVIPARLRAINPNTRGAFEILLLEENGRNDWWAMMRPGKRAPVGADVLLLDANGENSNISATVIAINDEGHRRLRFQRADPPLPSSPEFDLANVLDRFGEVPLPPYIKRDAGNSSADDRARYQTVYAETKGSVAAPTAGLHLTEKLLAQIRAQGVEVCSITLHVGPGTFAPVKTERVEEHVMHSERFHVNDAAAQKINAAKGDGRRVIAVGTTSVRVLETLAQANEGKMIAGVGRTNIFIHPPSPFRIVDALLTNFHLPRSTLLMLVSAFSAPNATCGRDMILAAYAEAVRERYRFFSYGDAMFIE